MKFPPAYELPPDTTTYLKAGLEVCRKDFCSGLMTIAARMKSAPFSTPALRTRVQTLYRRCSKNAFLLGLRGTGWKFASATPKVNQLWAKEQTVRELEYLPSMIALAAAKLDSSRFRTTAKEFYPLLDSMAAFGIKLTPKK